MKDATNLINHQGEACAVNGRRVRTISPPLFRGSTVLFDRYADLLSANAGAFDGVTYGTDRLPPQRLFEEAMRAFETGHLTRAFQSGIHAITSTLLAYTKSGDHILLCDNVYGPTAQFCREILSRYNIQIGTLPPQVGADISAHLRPNTRLIFLESPGSNTFEIQDIPAITTIARGILTSLDNTWATPLHLNPFKLGIDISIQSITKYVAGHSDILLGTVTTNDRAAKELDHFYRMSELYASSEDCLLALRGLSTLSVRLKQHERSALTIATWLEAQAIVDQVLHPALPSHPEHQLWKRDFTGSSGLFAFTLCQEPTEERMAAFIDSLKLFGIGYSWGGFKSLITAAHVQRCQPSRYSGRTILRLSIGLEDTDDLKADLEQGLSRLG
jgi:cystathionine beta-lyase